MEISSVEILLFLASPDDLIGVVWQENLRDDGRTIPTKRVTKLLVEFRKADPRVFLTG